MYRINSEILLSEGDVLENKARSIGECLDKLSTAERDINLLGSDSGLRDRLVSIIKELESQQESLRKLSHVLRAAAEVASDTDSRTVMICSHETQLRKNMVHCMMNSESDRPDSYALPVNVVIRGK